MHRAMIGCLFRCVVVADGSAMLIMNRLVLGFDMLSN